MKRTLFKQFNFWDVLNYSLLGLLSFICIFPFVYVISVSLSDPIVYQPLKFYLVPPKFSLASYAYLFGTKAFPSALMNTTYVTLIGTLLNLFVTFTFAFTLTRKTMPGRKIFNALVVFFLIFNAGMIPNYMLVGALGLKNSLWALIIMALTNSWSIIVVRSFMGTIPEEMYESAEIDGCNHLRMFFTITLPLSGPCLAAFALFFAVAHWNMYFDAMLYLQEADKWTLQVLVKTIVVQMNTYNVGTMSDMNTPPIETMRMASVVIAMAPIVCLYPFLQKYFVKGIMLGSVKG